MEGFPEEVTVLDDDPLEPDCEEADDLEQEGRRDTKELGEDRSGKLRTDSESEDEDGHLQEYFEIEFNEDYEPVSAARTSQNKSDDLPMSSSLPAAASSDQQQHRFRCKTCRVKFPADAYAAHKLSHPSHFRSQKRLLYCRLCELDFRDKPYAAYVDHIASVHKNAEGKFFCPRNCQARDILLSVQQ
jgi:hypothetical protein